MPQERYFLLPSVRTLDEVRSIIASVGPLEEPVYFLNEGKLKKTIETFFTYFLPELPHRAIAYAVKANPHPRILQLINRFGINHFDCASEHEIKTIHSLDPNSKILFNHPVKREKDIVAAFEDGVLHFTVDSFSGLKRIFKNIPDKINPNTVEIAVRLSTPNTKAKVNLSEKFGASEVEARALVRAVKDIYGAQPGLYCHTGSQNENTSTYAETVKWLMQIAREEGGVKFINIGGGFPANYHDDDSFELKQFLQVATEAIEKNLKDVFFGEPIVYTEPGRGIIAECVDLDIPILATEVRNNQKCIYMADGIYKSFSDWPVHGWKYNFKAHRNWRKPFSEELIPCLLYGCEPVEEDSLGEVYFPKDLQKGDYITVNSAGAYHSSQAIIFTMPHRYIFYNLVDE